MINLELAIARGISDEDIERIKECHQFRDAIEGSFGIIAAGQGRNIPEDIPQLLKAWRGNEAKLQTLWGFDVNSNYYKEFYIPGCSCPKEDNEQYVGTVYRYVSKTCPIHGQGAKNV